MESNDTTQWGPQFYVSSSIVDAVFSRSSLYDYLLSLINFVIFTSLHLFDSCSFLDKD